MKQIIIIITIAIVGCASDPPIDTIKPMILNVIESRYRVPQMGMCGSFFIYDTVLQDTVKPWYNLAARDTHLPCDQYIVAHNKQGTVSTNNIMIYAHFLLYSDSIMAKSEGTSHNLYNEFKGDCSSWLLDPTKPN